MISLEQVFSILTPNRATIVNAGDQKRGPGGGDKPDFEIGRTLAKAGERFRKARGIDS